MLRRRAGADERFASNDNWGDEPGTVAALREAGASDLDAGSKDAALVVVAPAGVYSVIVSGVNELTGEGLVEVFELP